MKKKFALRLFTALLFPVIIASCGKEEEQETVQPAADLVIDNSAVTLLQGDEITVSITSGNGDYSVKTFDESVATATIDGDKVTIKATENSVLDENNRAETTILVIDGRKKTARIKVQVAKLWDLTTDIPEEGIELFIGEKKTIEILTGNGDYKITMPEGAERYIKLDELSGQVFSVSEEALSYFENRLPYAIKEDILEYLKAERINVKKESEIYADYFYNDSNWYTVQCIIKDRKETLIDLKFDVPTKSQAETICNNWRSKSSGIYEYLVNQLWMSE